MQSEASDAVAPTPRVLVVDDDRAVRKVLKINLSKGGYDVTLATCGEEALEKIAERPVDVIFTDVSMPGMGGLQLLHQLKAQDPTLRVVVMTGYGSVEDAVAAMKAGADDYIIKPVTKDTVLTLVEKSLKERALRAELIQLRQEVVEKYGFEQIVGTSPGMTALYEQMAAVADTNARVLIQGETGTGKELIAHAMHYRSSRRSGPLVQLNCAALPESLLESELFGHEKGAFTGALRQHRGKFEQAHGGTLFLDEIGELPLATQAKLLRALEYGQIQRLGGSRTLNVDVRAVAATNRDLRAEVDAGRFREDLYYRLNVFLLQVPPLRERRDDVPLLVDHFVAKYCEANQRPRLTVALSTLRRMVGHDWPGNVRELQHVIERAVILSNGSELTNVRLPTAASEPDAVGPDPLAFDVALDRPLPEALADYERALIIQALKDAGGVQAAAARTLGISRSNLHYRIGRLGISIREIVYE